FNVLGIDPNFTTLAEDEATLLRHEVARELFADRYAEDHNAEFQKFIDCYGDGYDDRLITQVLHAHDLLCSVVDRDAWIARAQTRIDEPIRMRVDQSSLGRELMDLIRQRLAGYRIRC